VAEGSAQRPSQLRRFGNSEKRGWTDGPSLRMFPPLGAEARPSLSAASWSADLYFGMHPIGIRVLASVPSAANSKHANPEIGVPRKS
jgi:hypothetical protein